MEQVAEMKTDLKAHKEYCEHRFKEEERRHDAIDRQLQELTKIVTEMAVMQKQQSEQANDQESRIRSLENRRGEWFDKLISLALGAAVSFIATKLIG